MCDPVRMLNENNAKYLAFSYYEFEFYFIFLRKRLQVGQC